MNPKQQLQMCVDMLAEKYVPALRGAHVIRFVRQFEIWSASGQCFAFGSYTALLLWLGCVALTKGVRAFEHYPPDVLNLVYRSASASGVL